MAAFSAVSRPPTDPGLPDADQREDFPADLPSKGPLTIAVRSAIFQLTQPARVRDFIAENFEGWKIEGDGLRTGDYEAPLDAIRKSRNRALDLIRNERAAKKKQG